MPCAVVQIGNVSHELMHKLLVLAGGPLLSGDENCRQLCPLEKVIEGVSLSLDLVSGPFLFASLTRR